MRISRIYYSQSLDPNSVVELTDTTAHYLIQVLRIHIGDTIILFNGDGADYVAEVDTMQKKKLTVLIKTKIALTKESPLKIHLGQALTRTEKMDWILQKATELGAAEITPLITQHISVSWQAKLWEKRKAHWERVIISACEQSGRNCVPTLHEPKNLQAWLTQQTSISCGMVLDPAAGMKMQQLSHEHKKFSQVHLLIGPEGGLSTEEIQLAHGYRMQSISLGPRILRMETAALTAMSLVQSYFGDS